MYIICNMYITCNMYIIYDMYVICMKVKNHINVLAVTQPTALSSTSTTVPSSITPITGMVVC